MGPKGDQGELGLPGDSIKVIHVCFGKTLLGKYTLK